MRLAHAGKGRPARGRTAVMVCMSQAAWKSHETYRRRLNPFSRRQVLHPEELHPLTAVFHPCETRASEYVSHPCNMASCASQVSRSKTSSTTGHLRDKPPTRPTPPMPHWKAFTFVYREHLLVSRRELDGREMRAQSGKGSEKVGRAAQ